MIPDARESGDILPELIDFSQEGQALILQQLITADTPRIVVDIGAYDGVVGSNSRALVLDGWRGLLVEPIPAVFESLCNSYRGFSNVRCVEAAGSDRDGKAQIYLGKAREDGQLASMSKEPEILGNLSDRSIEVETVSLPALLAAHNVPDDFGVLLVDTEGYDLAVLQGLQRTGKRPRIVVTEELTATNEAKYRLLRRLGYGLSGVWGSDSIWILDKYAAGATLSSISARELPSLGRRPADG